MIRKNLVKTFSVIMAAMLAMMTVACGANTTVDETVQVTTQTQEEKELEESLTTSSAVASTESEAGKVETVYVKADANGAVNDVVVSEWLKNADASNVIADSTELKDIVNVKGSETFTDNGDGTLTWNASGADIYYQGTTDKELPVKMKISYTLDGKEISPEELAGKSGRVTIRFDYENTAKQTVDVDGKEIEVYTPFAMVSGMMLDSDKFSNVEISNGKIISDGGNYIVMGVAVPGLKESLDISDDKWDELEDDGELEEKLSNHFEITADTTDFELGMTITMASSDILSDFGLSDLSNSSKIDDLKDDMGELNDGSTKLVDGTKTLKDGTGELRDGVSELYDGTKKLYDGTTELKDGTKSLYDGVVAYTDGASQVNEGAAKLAEGASAAKDGTSKLVSGMKDGDIVGNAQKLADGAKQVSDGVSVLSAKLSGLSTMMNSLTAYQTELAQVKAAKAYLKGETSEWNDDVAVGFSIISGETIKGDNAQTTVNNIIAGNKSLTTSGENTIISTITTLKQMVDNYNENVVDVETGTIMKNENSNNSNDDNNNGNSGGNNDGENGNGNGVGTTDINGIIPADSDEPATNNNLEQTDKEYVDNAPLEEKEDPDEDDENSNEENEEQDDLILEDELYINQDMLNMLAVSLMATPTGNGGVGLDATEAAKLKALVNALSDNISSAVEAVATYNQLLGAANATETALTKILGTASSLSGSTGSSASSAEDLQKLVAGAKQVADGNAALASGISTIYSGAVALNDGIGALSTGASQLYSGTSELVSNNGELVDGTRKLSDGATELNDGVGELNDGVGELNDGVIELDDGVQELLDGVIKLDEEGIKKLYDAFDGDLTEFADKMTAIQKAGESYTTFGGASDDVDSSVKFIIKTDSIKSL